jgi:hypothetical protein
LADVAVERLDVAGVRQLADRAAADVEDVGTGPAVKRKEQLRIVVVVADLLEVDLDVGSETRS